MRVEFVTGGATHQFFLFSCQPWCRVAFCGTVKSRRRHANGRIVREEHARPRLSFAPQVFVFGNQFALTIYYGRCIHLSCRSWIIHAIPVKRCFAWRARSILLRTRSAATPGTQIGVVSFVQPNLVQPSLRRHRVRSSKKVRESTFLHPRVRVWPVLGTADAKNEFKRKQRSRAGDVQPQGTG